MNINTYEFMRVFLKIYDDESKMFDSFDILVCKEYVCRVKGKTINLTVIHEL